MAQLYFAFSRNNSALRRELESCLTEAENNPSYCFNWQHGEFCAFLFKSSGHRLVFGRDVFGRKSLCWRLLPTLSTSDSLRKGGFSFQLSIFPGRPEEKEMAEWHEVPPGNIFILKVPSSTSVKSVPNPKLRSSSTIFDLHLHCHMSSLDEFLFQTVSVHSYYPHDYFAENPIFKTFAIQKFITAEGAHSLLLPPSESPSLLSTGHSNISSLTEEFVRRFSAALEGILLSVPCINDSVGGDWSRIEVPVLFSGGVDSLMVALIAGEVLLQMAQKKQPTSPFKGRIRLFSVAFGSNEQEFAMASDRVQSISAYEHLKERSLEKYGVNPYSLVLINVEKSELAECRQQHIADAIAPSKTVLDDSLGCVLWFATRMRGVEFGTDSEIHCEVPFTLVGSGSDEQLGGYARHKTVFENKGMDGLTAELSMEMHRIGERNFGRDDRVGSSNGKAILAPFLEEELVRWLNKVPTALKTGFGLPASVGVPNKFLLRNALRLLRVPEHCVQRPKRAMQFGTRMVKMEMANGGKVKGTHICDRLLPVDT